MLPPFIIEQIRKREEEQLRQQQQPVLELPLPMRREEKRREPQHIEDDSTHRGVIIIDLKRD